MTRFAWLVSFDSFHSLGWFDSPGSFDSPGLFHSLGSFHSIRLMRLACFIRLPNQPLCWSRHSCKIQTRGTLLSAQNIFCRHLFGRSPTIVSTRTQIILVALDNDHVISRGRSLEERKRQYQPFSFRPSTAIGIGTNHPKFQPTTDSHTAVVLLKHLRYIMDIVSIPSVLLHYGKGYQPV